MRESINNSFLFPSDTKLIKFNSCHKLTEGLSSPNAPVAQQIMIHQRNELCLKNDTKGCELENNETNGASEITFFLRIGNEMN